VCALPSTCPPCPGPSWPARWRQPLGATRKTGAATGRPRPPPSTRLSTSLLKALPRPPEPTHLPA
jgi:hypothetical protein